VASVETPTLRGDRETVPICRHSHAIKQLIVYSSVRRTVIRIFSDLHYGDRASALTDLEQLSPLLDGPTEIMLNGDTLDTRQGPNPSATAEGRAVARDFFASRSPPASWLTGNHDPDISDTHARELAGGEIFVTHGDILFEDLVPWGRDANVLKQRIAEELRRAPMNSQSPLTERFRAYRRAAATIPQRHQAEKDPLKYTLGFLADTIWPPTRILRVIRAWRETPLKADQFLDQNGLPAQILVMGHTHRLGAFRTPANRLLLNTGSVCPPGNAGVVDVHSDRVILRAIERRGGKFHPGRTLHEIALAGAASPAKLRA
jgi:predicted phosphodiesterase